jgi:oligo-1,6-glucosidase
VATEERDPSSILQCYRRLLALRSSRPALHVGSLDLLDAGSQAGSLVGYRRRAGEDAVDVWLNASDRPERLILSNWIPTQTILFSTHAFASRPTELPRGDLHLMPYEAVVLGQQRP